MDRDEAIKLLRAGPEGIKEWNRLLADGEEIPNLANAFLINSDLRGADLRGAFLINSSFFQADLRDADLVGAQLTGADFRDADLRGTELRHANLSEAIFGGTQISCDLSKVGGLNSIVHLSRSVVDIQSLLHFRKKLPVAFLQGCGLANEEIAHFRNRIRGEIELHSCFICYCAKDELFASRLHDDFQKAGVRCWKWNHDARICEELLGDLHLPVGTHDTLVLVASKHSLVSESVNREIERIMKDADQLDQSGREKRSSEWTGSLCLVRLDNFLFDESEDGRPLWDNPWREQLMNRPIVDAVGWDKNSTRYQHARDALIEALKSSNQS
ncbi:MAG: toll/interleukin-1 receptor domain-containing protein [Phycisphaerales bacterium]|nr:toll/interleukin-1 receptor domain-containing protein [Phycisphaerales bacterium]